MVKVKQFSVSDVCEIIIPPTVEAIKDRAFFGCSQLTSVKLGEGLEEIGEEAFCGCELLQRIVIPPAVRAIKDAAFRRCLVKAIRPRHSIIARS